MRVEKSILKRLRSSGIKSRLFRNVVRITTKRKKLGRFLAIRCDSHSKTLLLPVNLHLLHSPSSRPQSGDSIRHTLCLSLISMIAYHLVFRARGHQTPFASRNDSLLMWRELSRHLGQCIALTLMPNHGHILIKREDQAKAVRAIRLSLLSFNRKTPTLWEPVPEPSAIPDIKHLRRQVRYVHLNPCRNGLCRDPLNWEFSTHRDYLGYTVGLFSALQVRDLGFHSKEAFHQFVSSDPSTNVTGTPLPTHIAPSEFPLVSQDRVANLTCTLTRTPLESLQKPSHSRRLFFLLAEAAGYRNLSQIGRYLKLSQQGAWGFVNRCGKTPYSDTLARQLLCDLRLSSHLE